MKTFNPILREYVAPVELSTLQGTYNTLEQGHKEAVKATSALKQAIAQYDLNEAENEWRAGKINEVQAIIENNTIDGNSAAAVDDLMAASGDILFGADMMGRLKRQQAWKANNDKIDKMNMPDDYKRIFKQLNPYGTYVDKYDENGNVYEGDTWKPTVNPVNTIPMSVLLDNALKWAAKEHGGGTVTRWLDKDGNVTDDISKSVTGEIFSATTGKWDRLSKDKLAKAVEAVIANTPGAKESLQQDYMIAKWKYNNGEESDVVGKNGIILTPTEYLNKHIDPFYDAATYYNPSSNTTYGDAWKAQLQATRTLANNSGTGASSIYTNRTNNLDAPQGKGNPITFENKMPIEAQSKINESKQILANLMQEAGVNGDISTMSEDNIRSNLYRITDKTKRFSGLQALSNLRVNTEYINTIKENISNDKDKLAKFDAYTSLMSLKNDDNSNPYIKQYNDIINKVYNGSAAIGQGFADDDTFNQFLINIGGRKEASKLGIEFKTIDGKQYAVLPKNNAHSLHIFTKAANDAFNQTHSFAGKVWNNAKNLIWSEWGDNVIKIDDNGDINYIGKLDNILDSINSNTVDFLGDIGNTFGIARPINDAVGLVTGATPSGLLRANTAETYYYDLNSLMNDLDETYNNTIKNGGYLTVSNNVNAQATPDMAEWAAIMKADPANASKYSTNYKLAKDEIMSLVPTIDLVQHGGYVLDKNNTLVKPTSEEAMEYTQLLRNAKESDIAMSGAQDPVTGNWGLNITIKRNKEDIFDLLTDNKEPVNLFIPDISNSTYERWNRDTNFRALNDIKAYSAANRPMDIVDDTFNLPTVTLIPYGNGFVTKDTNEYFSTEQAQLYRNIYLMYKDLQAVTLDDMLSGQTTIIPQARANMLSTIANALAPLYGGGEDAADYILENISNF